MEAPSARTRKDYTSRPGDLSRFFRMRQDGWKSKYKDLKATVKGDKNRLAHLTRSREPGRIRAERAGEQITTLEVEIAELGARLAALGGVNNQPRPEAVVLGRPPEGAVYVRLPPLGAWSWSGPGFSQAPAEASPLMTNSRLIQCHARVLPSPDQNGKSTPDRSKLFGSHGQRPWF